MLFSLLLKIKRNVFYDVLKKSSIIVIRKKNSNNNGLGNARPCCKCLNVMKKLGIKKIYYSNDDGSIIKENVKSMMSILLTSSTYCRFKRNGIEIDKIKSSMIYIKKVIENQFNVISFKQFIQNGLVYGLKCLKIESKKYYLYTIYHESTNEKIEIKIKKKYNTCKGNTGLEPVTYS